MKKSYLGKQLARTYNRKVQRKELAVGNLFLIKGGWKNYGPGGREAQPKLGMILQDS